MEESEIAGPALSERLIRLRAGLVGLLWLGSSLPGFAQTSGCPIERAIFTLPGDPHVELRIPHSSFSHNQRDVMATLTMAPQGNETAHTHTFGWTVSSGVPQEYLVWHLPARTPPIPDSIEEPYVVAIYAFDASMTAHMGLPNKGEAAPQFIFLPELTSVSRALLITADVEAIVPFGIFALTDCEGR